MHAGGFGGRNAPILGGSLGDGTPRKPLGGRGNIGDALAAWPGLPEPIKASIEAMVGAASENCCGR